MLQVLIFLFSYLLTRQIEGQESATFEASVSQESGVLMGATAAVPAPPAAAPMAAHVVPATADVRENGDRDDSMSESSISDW